MTTDTTPPPPFHTTEGETFIPYRINYDTVDLSPGWQRATIPALPGATGLGEGKPAARADVIRAAQEILATRPVDQYPPSDVKDETKPLTELAPMAADAETAAARKTAAMAVLRAMKPEATDEELSLWFDELRAELQGGMDKQAKMQAASSKPNNTGGVTVRLPKGAKLAMFGGTFVISSVGRKGFTAVGINGTKINPEPLPLK